MSATISINNVRATITEGAWSCEDPALLARIQALELPQYAPDVIQAREAVAELGGTIVAEDPDADTLDPDVLH